MYTQLFALLETYLKSLAQARRLEIVNLLRDQELCVSDIYRMLDLPQANVSQHLMSLRDAGILKIRRKGKHVYYSLLNPDITRALDVIRDILMETYKDTKLADEFRMKMHDLVPLVRDPVCGMRVSPKTAGFARDHRGKTYYFCASGCVREFLKNPDRYAQKD